MPIGNRALIIGINRNKMFRPISTAHLSLCDHNPQIIKFPDTKVFQKKNSKLLVDIYKSVQRKYYPEKDIYKKGEI